MVVRQPLPAREVISMSSVKTCATMPSEACTAASSRPATHRSVMETARWHSIMPSWGTVSETSSRTVGKARSAVAFVGMGSSKVGGVGQKRRFVK